jgi:hypothetical protein
MTSRRRTFAAETKDAAGSTVASRDLDDLLGEQIAPS